MENNIKIKRCLFLSLFASFFLVTELNKSAASANVTNNDVEAAHAILKSSCSSTLYPDICFSTITALPIDVTSKIKSNKDVINLSLNVTETSIRNFYQKIRTLYFGQRGYTKGGTVALKDCLETITVSISKIREVVEIVKEYPSAKKAISEQSDDLNTYISSAMTNLFTCNDGFSHGKAERKIRESFLSDGRHGHRLCSNILAMIKNMTDTDMEKEQKQSSLSTAATRGKLGEEDGIKWPGWLSSEDRRILLSDSTLTPDVTVATDGTGDYTSVSDAVAAAPSKSNTRYVIKIKKGKYTENVIIPSDKTYLLFVGDGNSNTFITESLNAKDNGSTYNSATVAVNAKNFLARDITFQNTAGAEKEQAVALRVSGDYAAFYKCSMIAFQDTLYVHTERQFYVNCVVIGTVDFIFGNAAVVFQDSDLHARLPGPKQQNMLTAQGRDDKNQNTGIVIQKCRIGATSDLEEQKDEYKTYLGRPWQEYSRTIVMQSEISDIIDSAGWHPWNESNFALDTLTYREYKNTGDGADTSQRVTWKGFKVMTSDSEAEPYTIENFISSGEWLDETGFPYYPGL